MWGQNTGYSESLIDRLYVVQDVPPIIELLGCKRHLACLQLFRSHFRRYVRSSARSYHVDWRLNLRPCSPEGLSNCEFQFIPRPKLMAWSGCYETWTLERYAPAPRMATTAIIAV